MSDEPDVAMTYGDLRDLAEHAGLTDDAPVFVETSWAVDTRHPVEAGSSSDGELRLWIDVAFNRAAAQRDVETLLRKVERSDDVFVVVESEEVQADLTPSDLAALIVDRVLGAEQDGETP